MTSYCTLADAVAELKADTVGADNLAALRRNIRVVSKRIDEEMGNLRRPFFAPYLEQRKFRITADRINTWDRVFWLKDHIVAFTVALKGTETITTSVELYSDTNAVATGLRFTNGCGTWYSGETPPVFVTVTGTWGWHEDWDNAWNSVDTVQDAGGITTVQTSIKVTDADGADLDGFTPRFSPGNLIQIGSEYMDVLAVNNTTQILTVRRARNGTTAAAHALNAAISTFQVDERIRRITARQANQLYAKKGAYQVETFDAAGSVTYPQDLLAELRNALVGFIYG